MFTEIPRKEKGGKHDGGLLTEEAA